MKKLTVENWKELQQYINLADYHEYNSNAMTLLMWSNRYEAYFETYEDFALVYTKMPHRKPVWLMPFCALEHRKKAVTMLKKRCEELAVPYEIHSMTKEFKDWLMQEYPFEFLIWDCYNARDYVYDRSQQETLTGKKMQKRRNHFHAFIKQYEGRYRYKALEREDIPHIVEFLKRWKAVKKEEEYETIDAEGEGIALLFQHWEELPLEGGCIYIDNKLEAFSITSRLAKDTVQIHVEKANRDIRGLYIAILKFYLETLDEEVRYINREDDMGLSELRKAKSDMQPVFKIQKFGSCHQQLQIQKATEKWQAAIEKLWSARFDDETEESTQYYFSHSYKPEDTWLLCSGDELIAMAQFRPIDIALQKQREHIYFLFGVATNQDYEGCGYMKLLLHMVMQKKPYADAKFIFLQAYNWDIYRSLGFQERYQAQRWKLNKNAYTKPAVGNFSEDYTIQELLHLYNIYTKNKEGYRLRDEAYYEEQFLPYADLWGQKLLVYKQDGQAKGYLLIAENAEELEILECIYIGDEVLQNMLQLLAKHEKKVYLHTFDETHIEGKCKPMTVMMVKAQQTNAFPQEHLFINETL